MGLIAHSTLHPVIAKIIVETAIVSLNYLVMRSLIFRNDPVSGLRD
jgi:hypothetical protein